MLCFQGRSNLGEKKRWSSVRSYLCGDEFNSVLAVDDSGSIKDSDTLITMSQQLSSDFGMPFGSVIAIEDSASVKHLEDDDSLSVKSSEATVTQPLQEKKKSKVLSQYVKEEDVDNESEATETHIPKKHQTAPISKLFLEEDAAVIIQSAFRSYLVSFFPSFFLLLCPLQCFLLGYVVFRQYVGAKKKKKHLLRRRASHQERNLKARYPWGHH